MKRGRPAHSVVRQNIIELLAAKGSAYGYELYKAYMALFPPVAMRTIYYHLRKGCERGEFKVERIEKSEGAFSWGPASRHILYTLGEKAEPRGNEKVKAHVEMKD